MESPYSEISENVKYIRERIDEAAAHAGRDPAGVRLMAVTKTQPPEKVNAVIAAGVTLLGENRAQELLQKYDDYDKRGVSIHFIGHLQSNKVRQVIDKVEMIHSVDSAKLATEIDRQAAKCGKICDVLIEVNVGREASKSGVLPEEVPALADELAGFANLRLRGLMTIPPFDASELESDRYFSLVNQLYVDIQAEYRDNRNVNVLSMGMSQDFEQAIRHGSTLVRIGTALFGKR